ncbi:MAG: cysteine-rich CWC family protein [Limnohabitans sp.]
METSWPIDPSRCPLCGGPNACAMASPGTGRTCGSCWCVSEFFSAELLGRVPARVQRQACICLNCVAAGQKAGEGAR